MALVPLSGTDIRFLSGVPFSNDYKNTRWFDTESEQTNYFLNKPTQLIMSQSQFQRVEGRTYIKANVSVDQLRNVNYVMFRNTAYNNKWFYAFVTKLEYKQEKTTYVYFELDVFQTWKFNMNFKPSYVVREHCPLWDSNGNPIINTQDEGLNYGTEYDDIHIEHWKPFDDVYFLVIVAKSVLHGAGKGDIDFTINGGFPSPLIYYIHPFRLFGNDPAVSINGTPVTLSSASAVLTAVFTSVASVNDIAAIYVTDYPGLNVQYGSTVDFDGVEANDCVISGGTGGDVTTLHIGTVSQYSKNKKDFGSKYDGYSAVSESKLRMYPYNVLTITDLKGNATTLKNEYINSTNLELTCFGSLGSQNKNAYSVENYLINNDGTNDDFNNVSMLNGIINVDPNDVPILNDYLSAFLQGHKNSIENQKHSIVFNGVMDGVGNAIGGIASGLTGNALGVGSSVAGVVKGSGNAVLQMQGIQAKIKDISNHPPQLSKMGSNTAFDFGNRVNGIYIIKKEIKPEYRKKLTDFFNMFGYKLNEVKIPNFHTRQNWNYVQTKACNITGDFNNEDLQELKSIFDNGVTLWHTDDVGNYDLGNGVI